MVTAHTAPCEHFSELRLPKRLLHTQLGSWQQPASASLLSRPLIPHTYVMLLLSNWLLLSAGLKGGKRRNNEQQELWGALTEELFFSFKMQGFSDGYGPFYVNPIISFDSLTNNK